ncbi:MucR family transcriptional regulator [Pseudorhizobium flavum]|uniref:MucR family transcriptional regulator n=1 Tax=Pseudorhizobium flavum TaxID=1335061 RepID=UPI00376F5326
MSELEKDVGLVSLTADLVAAYLHKNVVPASTLPELITGVHTALKKLGASGETPAIPRQQPAVPVRKSIKSDAIACLECGRNFKSLRRHISANHGLAPEEYRAKWELPADYPLVAPEYAQQRSALAKEMGLGQQRAERSLSRKKA